MEDRLLTSKDAERLLEIAEREYRHPRAGRRFSQTDRPNESDLIPDSVRGKGSGNVDRFLRLEVADPLRTEVLCYLATRDTLKWMGQHYPPDQLEAMAASGEYRQAQRADHIRMTMAETTAEREYACLLSRHPEWRNQVEDLITAIKHEEVVAFKRALGLDLFEYPHRS